MKPKRLLIVLLILVTLLSPGYVLAGSGMSPLLVVPVSADWAGTTSRNYPMSFTVQSSGTQWSNFKLKTNFNATNCGATGTLELTIIGPGSISNSQFNVSSGNGFTAHGQFTSSTSANGTYTFTNYPIPIGPCTYFFNQSGTWTASSGSPSTPTPTRTRTPTPIPTWDPQTPTPTSPPTSLTLESTGTLDGWILESSETSNQGGTMNAAGPTFNLGDNVSNKQYRAIVSFCPSGLPSNAIITKAVLRIKRQGMVGTNPFTTHQKIAVDIRQGSFSNNLALQLNDFRALASRNGVGLIANNPKPGNWYVGNLNSTAFPYIHFFACIQLRLRFQLDDNNDLGADLLRFYSGDATPVARPKLILTYIVP